MITLTALIRCKPGSEDHIRAALLEVARHAADREDGTVSYFVSEAAEGGLFVTHERYADQAALDAHNGGAGAKAFFAKAEGHLDRVEVAVGPEIFAG
jgi:quinol monooxygenase YgiN